MAEKITGLSPAQARWLLAALGCAYDDGLEPADLTDREGDELAVALAAIAEVDLDTLPWLYRWGADQPAST